MFEFLFMALMLAFSSFHSKCDIQFFMNAIPSSQYEWDRAMSVRQKKKNVVCPQKTFYGEYYFYDDHLKYTKERKIIILYAKNENPKQNVESFTSVICNSCLC